MVNLFVHSWTSLAVSFSYKRDSRVYIFTSWMRIRVSFKGFFEIIEWEFLFSCFESYFEKRSQVVAFLKPILGILLQRCCVLFSCLPLIYFLSFFHTSFLFFLEYWMFCPCFPLMVVSFPYLLACDFVLYLLMSLSRSYNPYTIHIFNKWSLNNIMFLSSTWGQGRKMWNYKSRWLMLFM